MLKLPGHSAPENNPMTRPVPVKFDPQRRSAKRELTAAIKAFTGHLEREECRLGMRRRARRPADQHKFGTAVEAIACNLLITAAVSPEATLNVPRGHGAMWGESRYRTPVYGQHFIDILDLLQSLELITQVTKGYRYSKRASQPTTVRPNEAVSHYLPLGSTPWDWFRYEKEPEVIILKKTKDIDNDDASPLINYTDTHRTKQWRQEIKVINTWLTEAPITIVEDAQRPLSLDKFGQPVEPYRRPLRRVFNNGSWNAGGRLYGSFWMTMERDERFRAIRIEDEEIANVDYSSLYPRLAYVRAGADQHEGDIYDVTGDGSCRDGWKTLINALLFTNRPLRNWPKDTLQAFPPGTRLRDAIAAIKQRHAPIAKLFGQGLGYELMRHESGMLVSVVTALFKHGITALPLHDSVLVARSHAETAKRYMVDEFQHRTGLPRAFVKIDYGPD
jgi:hypothetical protein